MKNKKNTKGITLIALVVTIVVLLILAAVSINMLKGENGIIARATEAREKNKYASAKEKVDMAKMASLDSTGEVDKDKLVDELNKVGTVESENWPVIANVDGYVFSIDEDGNIESPKSYNITYALNGGTNADGNPTTYTGLEDVFLKYPTKDGSAFDGWYYEGNFSGERISKIDKTKGDVTVYAKWQEETNDDYFTWIESSDYAVLDTFSDLGLEKYNAGELNKIIIPKKHNGLDVTQIDNWAFTDKNLINEVFIPDCVRTIGFNAFKNCTELEKITYPISVGIGNRSSSSNVAVFVGCENVRIINFTKGTGIGYDYTSGYGGSCDTTPWYYSRNNDIKITFEEGITKIGNYTFYECTGLKGEIKLPRSLEQIGEAAFYKCSELSGKIIFSKNVVKIGKSAFEECSSLTGQLKLPESIMEIGDRAFYGCSGINGRLKFVEKVTKIPSDCFGECSGIEELIIPENITEIEFRAFTNCSGIKKITCPISLKIGWGNASQQTETFQGCTGVEEVNFTKGTGVGFNYTSGYGGSKDTTPWYYSRNNRIKVTFEEGITRIGDNTFFGCTGLECEIKLPRSLREIGVGAFYNCINLTGNINLPPDLTTLGGTGTFYNCKKITGKLEIPKNVTEIPTECFENCEGIEELIIPENIPEVGHRAFTNCSGIKKITCPISLKMGWGNSSQMTETFQGCTGVEEVYFTKGTGEGFDYTSGYGGSRGTTPWYYSRNNDIKITFEEGITKIGNNTFYEQTKATFYFDGTADQWSGVTIGTGNEALANINFLK